MIKHILIAVFLLITTNSCKWWEETFGPKPAPAPQGIVVTVKDKNTGKPIANANVKWVKADKEGSGPTSIDGVYRKEGLDIGDYQVTITANGYKIDKVGKKLSVPVGKMAEETFELDQESPLEFSSNSITIDSKISSTGTVILKNKSTQYPINLTIEIPQNDQWVKVAPTTLTIPAGSQKDLLITVDNKGRGFGTYNSTIILNYTQNNSPFSDNLFVNMIISNPSAPSVTTNSINGITQTTADITATLTNLGGSNVSLRGICWSEGPNPDPKIDPKTTIIGGGLGAFTLTASNLKEGKAYWVRAYAENANGIGLGEAIQFTTSITPTPPTVILNPVTNITQISAILSGKVSNNGGTAVTDQGFCWSTSANPKITDSKVQANTDATGNMSANMTGLTQGVVYYVRAYAINSLGANKVGYSNEISFKTQVPTTAAKLTTAAPTGITETSAKLQASVTELGSSPIKEHGYVWSRQNATPEIGNSEKNQMGSKPEASQFSPFTLNNLKKGTLYYFRAYATSNDGQTFYGNTQTLVTKEQGLVLYYPFNGDATDVSGNAKNGIVTAKQVNDKYSNEKSAFDLSSGTIQVQDQTVGRFVGDFTFSLNIKINASTFKGSKKVIFSKGSNGDCVNSGDWSGFAIFSDPQNSSLSIYINSSDGKKDELKLCESSLLADEWHNLVIVKTGSSIKIYVDGLYINKVETPFSTIGFGRRYLGGGTEGSLTIGGFSYQNSAEWCQNYEKSLSIIDDFRLYSYGLSETEVEELSKR